jgi:CHASE2 domain-containing sensor protein
MPWTQFAGPFGIDGDLDRTVILRGSPQWYGVYLLLLCALGVLVALLRDDEHPRRRLTTWTVVVAGLAVVCCVLAMLTGVDATMVNPLHSSPT